MDICKISRRKLILSTFGHWISSNIGRFERFSTLLRSFLTPNNIVWLLRMIFFIPFQSFSLIRILSSVFHCMPIFSNVFSVVFRLFSTISIVILLLHPMQTISILFLLQISIVFVSDFGQIFQLFAKGKSMCLNSWVHMKFISHTMHWINSVVELWAKLFHASPYTTRQNAHCLSEFCSHSLTLLLGHGI